MIKNGNYHLLVEYQTDLSDKPKSYEKVEGSLQQIIKT